MKFARNLLQRMLRFSLNLSFNIGMNGLISSERIRWNLNLKKRTHVTLDVPVLFPLRQFHIPLNEEARVLDSPPADFDDTLSMFLTAQVNLAALLCKNGTATGICCT